MSALSTSTTYRRKLLVVFNRAPVSYARDADGQRVARRGGGGVVTALGGLLAHHDVTWVASAMTQEDRAVAAERGGSFVEETAEGASYRLRLVAHDPAAYDRFYNLMANPTFIEMLKKGIAAKEAVDKQVADALKTMNVATRKEVRSLEHRIAALEAELAELRAASAPKPRARKKASS